MYKSWASEMNSNRQIYKIYRIQNPDFYGQYLVEKEIMKKKYIGNTNILSKLELKLFHGTDKSAVKKINEKGFDRSYCGKNATAFGQGVYFAKGFEYSAQDKYSVPANKGKKYIYTAKVLVGESCQGTSDMKHLPENPRTRKEYDSAADNLLDPNIYVIFRDTQAYPEFLIVLK